MQFLRKSHQNISHLVATSYFCALVFFFFHIVCAAKQIVDEEFDAHEAPWFNTTVDSGIVVKGLYLLTMSLTPLHRCLKIALDLHVRFLFGLKVGTNYALQFHRLDRELHSHSDTIIIFLRLIAVLSTSYECRGCPGVVVDSFKEKQTIICSLLKK